MRVLHTSDWHVGRTFHGVDLLVDQARALSAIAELVAEESVDVVVVPGDISSGAFFLCAAAAVPGASSLIALRSSSSSRAIRCPRRST